jgi:hypothetical protein
LSVIKGDTNVKLSSKAFIIHDDSGKIVGVGRVPEHLRDKVGVRIERLGHSVLEVELDAEQAAMSVSELHQSHEVHMPSKKLVRKGD